MWLIQTHNLLSHLQIPQLVDSCHFSFRVQLHIWLFKRGIFAIDSDVLCGHATSNTLIPTRHLIWDLLSAVCASFVYLDFTSKIRESYCRGVEWNCNPIASNNHGRLIVEIVVRCGDLGEFFLHMFVQGTAGSHSGALFRHGNIIFEGGME